MAGLRKVTDNIGKRTKNLEVAFKKIPPLAAKYFKDITPINTGNARNSTVLSGNSIEGNYNYANKLNAGYSRQAPKGMTDPTIEFIRSEIKKI